MISSLVKPQSSSNFLFTRVIDWSSSTRTSGSSECSKSARYCSSENLSLSLASVSSEILSSRSRYDSMRFFSICSIPLARIPISSALDVSLIWGAGLPWPIFVTILVRLRTGSVRYLDKNRPRRAEKINPRIMAAMITRIIRLIYSNASYVGSSAITAQSVPGIFAKEPTTSSPFSPV